MKKPNEPKTPTEEQTNANRRNAAKSTGPRTTEGKAASSRNALKHGLCADQHLLPGEDPEDFRLLLDDLFGRFRPVGDGEETLVLRIAADQWRLDRALPMEAGIFRDRFHDVAAKEELRQQQYTTKKGYAEQDGEPVPPPPTPPVEGDLLARAFNVDCEGPNSFTKLARYESSIERSIDRCLRQLKAFQAARNNPPASGPQTGPEPPSAPPKTEDYETNPNDGGIDAGPAPPTDGPAETSPKNENDETNPKNEGSTTSHQPPVASHGEPRSPHGPTFTMTSVISSCCGAPAVNASAAAISRSIVSPAGSARHACAAAIMRSSPAQPFGYRRRCRALRCELGKPGGQALAPILFT